MSAWFLLLTAAVKNVPHTVFVHVLLHLVRLVVVLDIGDSVVVNVIITCVSLPVSVLVLLEGALDDYFFR